MQYNAFIPDFWEQSTLVTVLTSWYYGPLLATMKRQPEGDNPTSASASGWGWDVEETLVPLPQNGDVCARYDLQIEKMSGPSIAVPQVSLEDALCDIRSRVFWRGRANRRVRASAWQQIVFSRSRISASLLLFFP